MCGRVVGGSCRVIDGSQKAEASLFLARRFLGVAGREKFPVAERLGWQENSSRGSLPRVSCNAWLWIHYTHRV